MQLTLSVQIHCENAVGVLEFRKYEYLSPGTSCVINAHPLEQFYFLCNLQHSFNDLLVTTAYAV